MRKVVVTLVVVSFLLVPLTAMASGTNTGKKTMYQMVTDRYFEGAYNYYQEGFYNMAIRFFKLVLRRDHKYKKAAYWLARSYHAIGSLKRELGAWKLVLRIDPRDRVAKYFVKKVSAQLRYGRKAYDYYEKAYFLFKKGKLREALKLYKKVVSMNPKFTAAYYWVGRIYHELGMYDEEIPYLKKALELNPNYNDVKYLLRLAEKRQPLSSK